MANRTDKEAHTIHGTNPQNLVEKIVRQKVYQTVFWKEKCFALTAESILEVAVNLKCVGGSYGGQRKPCDFLCLILKMLQIQPDKEIIIEYIKNEEFKYVRILGAFYMRLVGRPLEVYQYLEPLYNDYRKLRYQTTEGHFKLMHVDELVDDMLRKDYIFDIALPRIPARYVYEKTQQLDPRISVLDEEFDEAILELEAGEAAREAAALEAQAKEAAAAAPRLPPPPERRPSPERGRGRDADRATPERDHERAATRDREAERRPDRERDREQRDRDKDRGYDRERDYERDRDRDYDRDRERSRRSPDRGRERDRERDDRRHERYDDRRERRSRSREGRRERDYTRDEREGRERRRSPEREHRDAKERDYERSAKAPRDKDRDYERERGGAGGGKGGVGGKSRGGADGEDPEIAAANELRAKLGLKPLK